VALGDILKGLTQGVNGITNTIFNPKDKPSPMDLVMANQPMGPNRGFLGIMGNISNLGAKQRVAWDQEQTRSAKEEADLELKKQQAAATGALGGLRNAQAQAIPVNVDIKRMLAESSASKNAGMTQAALYTSEARMKDAQTHAEQLKINAMRANTEQDRVEFENAYHQQLAAIREGQMYIDEFKANTGRMDVANQLKLGEEANRIRGQVANTDQNYKEGMIPIQQQRADSYGDIAKGMGAKGTTDMEGTLNVDGNVIPLPQAKSTVDLAALVGKYNPDAQKAMMKGIGISEPQGPIDKIFSPRPAPVIKPGAERPKRVLLNQKGNPQVNVAKPNILIMKDGVIVGKVKKENLANYLSTHPGLTNGKEVD
jgi:hypothetical protein